MSKPEKQEDGRLNDGTPITFLGDVIDRKVDFLNATIETPAIYKGRKITRQSTSTNTWTLVPL